MGEPHVISALRKKRAELAGEVVTAQLRLGKLRDDLDAIDRTLRVFDPRQHPEKIRPVVKRKGDKLFAYGECTRAILNTLRNAPEPMTVDQVAERVALDCRIATETPDVAVTLLWRVKAALDRLGKRGLLTASGKPARWAVKP
jgi:phosphoglycolate phosphatase-like HAD superfamily hydrolase